MNVRVLLTAGALSLGLALTSTAFAQGMQPEPMQQGGMQGQPGQMGDEMGQQQRPMKRPAKKMKKPMKQKKMMRAPRQPMQQDGMQHGGGMGAAPDEGM